jgi:hypothetical protein
MLARRPPNWGLFSAPVCESGTSPRLANNHELVSGEGSFPLSDDAVRIDLNYALVLIVLSVSCSKKERIESLERADRTMRSDRLPGPSHYGLQTSSAIHSESKDLDLLRLENKQLRGLVIHLSQIVFKNVMEAQRPRSDCSPIAPSEPPV